eukprot:TRINITY_DN3996_c0_g1_i2.p1 TRINITY_DN3996_c0_g1~~TRINITY_DN3996_c0_g1_i2.p1  ORF type:complete len:288 (-),score=30.96 TRINITY_DN3996_c0_g1_i2:150-1013(-)
MVKQHNGCSACKCYGPLCRHVSRPPCKPYALPQAFAPEDPSWYRRRPVANIKKPKSPPFISSTPRGLVPEPPTVPPSSTRKRTPRVSACSHRALIQPVYRSRLKPLYGVGSTRDQQMLHRVKEPIASWKSLGLPPCNNAEMRALEFREEETPRLKDKSPTDLEGPPEEVWRHMWEIRGWEDPSHLTAREMPLVAGMPAVVRERDQFTRYKLHSEHVSVAASELLKRINTPRLPAPAWPCAAAVLQSGGSPDTPPSEVTAERGGEIVSATEEGEQACLLYTSPSPRDS